jgi:predicted ArsR family transcriptional regulator
MMTAIEAQRYIAACRQMLEKAEDQIIKDYGTAVAVGALVVAIRKLAEVVEDLANREQGKVQS